MDKFARRNFQSDGALSPTPSDSSVAGGTGTAPNLLSTFPCAPAEGQQCLLLAPLAQKGSPRVNSERGAKGLTGPRVLPRNSCCEANRAQPAQSVHGKEHFQAPCKKPSGQSDTEKMKLLILRAITSSRAGPSSSSLVVTHHLGILVFSPGTPEVR